jgi:hypothetical protein
MTKPPSNDKEEAAKHTPLYKKTSPPDIVSQENVESICVRLRVLREALGYYGWGGQAKFSSLLMAYQGRDHTTVRKRYAKWEGDTLPDIGWMMVLSTKFNVPLDYIYLGKEAGVPKQLMDRIRVLRS